MLPMAGDGAHGFNVALHCTDWGNVIEGIEVAATIGAIQEQRVGVDVLDVAAEWDAPEPLARALPPLEDSGLANVYPGSAAVVDVDLVAVIDGNVPGVGELAGAEQRCAAEGWDHVNGTCRVPETVL